MENEDVDTGSVETGNETGETQPTGNETPNINPAWNDLLGQIPESLHHLMIPQLQKWDQGVQQRFATVQSQYAPYKEILDQKIDPNELIASHKLAQMIAENPRDFYDKMGQYYADEWGIADQGQAPNEEDEYSLDDFGDDEEPNNLENNPLFKQLQEQQAIIANFLAADVQQKQQADEARIQAQADADVKAEIDAVTAKYGNGKDLEPNFVKAMLSWAVQNQTTIEEAADTIAQMTGLGARPPAPQIVSPSGGVPMNNVNPADLNGRQTRDLVQQILKSAQQQG